jgi:hypothetical protein
MKRTPIIFYKIAFLLLLGVNFQLKAQNESIKQGTHNFYLELGGSGIFYSINYEKYLFKNKSENLTWTARIGGAFNPIDYKFMNSFFLDKQTFMLPFTSSLLIGASKDKLEVGAGFTMLTKNFNDQEIVPELIFGLRVIDVNRVCLRLNYIPLFRSDETIHWIGVSLGKNFGKIQ